MGTRTTVASPKGAKVHVRRGWSAHDGFLTACGRYLRHGIEGGTTSTPSHPGVTCGPCVTESNAAAERGHWKD